MIWPPPTSPLFPYTTLFRSAAVGRDDFGDDFQVVDPRHFLKDLSIRFPAFESFKFLRSIAQFSKAGKRMLRSLRKCLRSEEHTSELQSRRELVCRLLLEKQK